MLERCDVVLVGTAHAENIGAVARLLDNFGGGGWTLVAPRAALDDGRAAVVARTARGRLAAARVVATLDEALAACSYVVGFSARRGSERPMVGLRQLAAQVTRGAPDGRVALVFGPEDSGLDAAAIARCDAVAVIDTPGALPSLNLAQAVAVALWELTAPASEGGRPAHSADASDSMGAERVPVAGATASIIDAAGEGAGGAGGATTARKGATRAELDALVAHVARALDDGGYFRDRGERERREVHWRRVLANVGLRGDDLRALHGLCDALVRAGRQARER